MSQNKETLNPANVPKPEFAKTVNANKIAGEVIYITGYNHNRGKPNDYTSPDRVGEDGLTDYYTITTDKPFEIDYKDEGKQPINHFYTTYAVGSQIERLPNYKEVLENGGAIGPVKLVKRKSDKSGKDYWCLAYEGDEDF